MEIATLKSEALFEELTTLNIEIQFSDKVYEGYPWMNPITDEISITEVSSREIKTTDGKTIAWDSHPYIPFTVVFNEKYIHPEEKLFYNNWKYSRHLNSLTKNTIEEIDKNIKLRMGIWDILDYFSTIKIRLRDILNEFKQIKNTCPDRHEVLYQRSDAPIKTNLPEETCYPTINNWIHFALSHFWREQVSCINKIIDYIEIREKIVEKSDDYVKAIADIPVSLGTLIWRKNDTDLLELITALVESGSIQNSTKDLTRKEAIELISQFFNLEIKDAEVNYPEQPLELIQQSSLMN